MAPGPELRLARLEARKQALRGEPSLPHPFRPARKGSKDPIDGDRFVTMAMQPVGKAVDMAGGNARPKPLLRNR